MSLESEIGILETLLDNIPTSGDSNMTKIRDIEITISFWKANALFISLWRLLTPIVEGKAQAIKLQAIATITPDEQSQPKELFYHESSQDQRWLFFTRRDICNQDIIASLYTYAANVIDIKACLADDNTNTLMPRTWEEY